jgi:hypothetical protein
VAEEPTVWVDSWRITKTVSGDLHLHAILESGSLRITSSIVTFVPETATLTTQSGRRYELLGPPESRRLQLTMLNANAVRAGLAAAVDISDDLWERVTKQ